MKFYGKWLQSKSWVLKAFAPLQIAMAAAQRTAQSDSPSGVIERHCKISSCAVSGRLHCSLLFPGDVFFAFFAPRSQSRMEPRNWIAIQRLGISFCTPVLTTCIANAQAQVRWAKALKCSSQVRFAQVGTPRCHMTFASIHNISQSRLSELMSHSE